MVLVTLPAVYGLFLGVIPRESLWYILENYGYQGVTLH